MIEFKGYISGKSEKHFKKNNLLFGLNVVIISLLIFLPIVIIAIFKTHNFNIFGYYCLLCAVAIFAVVVPRPKKEQKSQLPKRIFIEDDCIICVADVYTESKFIDDVKKVIDYGEFYDIRFPLGNFSEKFICQKSLLVKGTLEDFEVLFEGKIERRCLPQ